MIDAILKGIALGFLLIISVSPVVFAIIKQSINNGYAGGFSFAAGVWLSDLIWVVLSNLFSDIVVGLLAFQKEIGITGSIFLACLGVYYLFFKKVHLKEDENKIVISAGTHAKLALSGFLINTLNPTLILFWLTTATTITAAGHSLNQRIVIFATCLLINAAVDIAKVMLAGKLRTKLNEKNISLINKLSGLILLGFGVVLLLGVFYTKR